MSLRKFFCGTLAAAMIFSASTFCGAATEDSANAKLARIEIDTYGAEQSGALLDRISRLEKSFNGENVVGNMNSRIDTMYKNLYDNNAGPSLLSQINALEWNISHEVSSAGIDSRLAALEIAILGSNGEGTFTDRIRALAKASFGEESLPIAQVTVPANTLIKVETTAPVSSKTMQEGDTLPFRVIEDVIVNGNLVFVTGLPGEGTVTKVLRAKNIFSNGKIETDFHTLKTIDGQSATVFTGVESVEEMTKLQMSRGLSLIGQTFSGKYSGVEEVFMRGKNIDLPEGIELYVQVKEPIVVYGLSMRGEKTSIAEPVNNPQPVTETPPPVTEPQTPPVTETNPPPVNEPAGLSDDEKIAAPPPPPPVEQPKPEPPKVETPKPTQPVEQPKAEQPAPTEGNELEIIEIYDED